MSTRRRPATKIVRSGFGSCLEGFAHSFHQDFALQYPSVELGGRELIEQLDPAARRALASELGDFLAKHETSNERGLRNAWLKLGAQYWPRRGPTKAILTAFLQQLLK